MSEERFKSAKGNLAFSQSLVDKMRMEDMAQPQDEMEQSMEAPQEMEPETPVDNQPLEEQPEQDIAQVVKDTMEPYMEEIKTIVEDKKPQEVELKIEGEMSPKEEEK